MCRIFVFCAHGIQPASQSVSMPPVVATTAAVAAAAQRITKYTRYARGAHRWLENRAYDIPSVRSTPANKY